MAFAKTNLVDVVGAVFSGSFKLNMQTVVRSFVQQTDMHGSSVEKPLFFAACSMDGAWLFLLGSGIGALFCVKLSAARTMSPYNFL